MNNLLRRAVAGGSIGLLLSMGLVVVSTGSASAGTEPSGSPRFYIGQVETDRGNGAEIPFPAMQQISDLYNQAGLYGCTLVATGTGENQNCVDTADVATTDYQDNYDHDEEDQSVVVAQTSGAIPQLCGTSPTAISIDYVRGIQAAIGGSTCTGETGDAYARDSVVAETFPGIIPGAYGATIVDPANSQTYSPGNPAAGWRPGDPMNGPYSGVAFTNLTNNDNGGGVNSLAYRIYCATGSSRITDWGQLTDPTQPVGSGAPIGMPINLFAVTPTAGTFKTLQTFVASGVVTPACNANVNATADTVGAPLLASDAAQISIVTQASNAGDANPVAGQALEEGEGLYFESNGIYNTNPYKSSVTINTVSGTFAASKTKINGISASTSTELAGTIATDLYVQNIYLTTSLRASTAGFLNWICDNNDTDKATDNDTGLNYNDEITTILSTEFGFPRISCPIITSVANTGS